MSLFISFNTSKYENIYFRHNFKEEIFFKRGFGMSAF
jgi:hypothetical protein